MTRRRVANCSCILAPRQRKALAVLTFELQRHTNATQQAVRFVALLGMAVNSPVGEHLANMQINKVR